MNYSVIIPVFQAEKFIERAVESALAHNEVREVILIEDGSPDDSLLVCKKLENKYSRVRLYSHKNGLNKGAGASRNLGIKKATCEFITFLDADDYWLPNRFEAENRIFRDHPEVDGVYGALGFHYYSDEFREKYAKKGFSGDLTTVKEKIPPEKLKYVLSGMCRDDKGYFSIVASTVKKKLIERVGYMNTQLALHQDTDLLVKLSHIGTLVPGIIDTAVGMRGVHGANRITSSGQNAHSRYLLFTAMEDWLQNNVKGEDQIKRFTTKDRAVYGLLSSKKNRLAKTISLIQLFYKEPFVFYIEYSFNILLNGIYGGRIGRIFIQLRKKALNTVFRKQAQKWDMIIYDHYCD